MTPHQLNNALNVRFPGEWLALTVNQRAAVRYDLREMLRDEYDVPSPSMHDSVMYENAINGTNEYVRRIGKGNLLSYARSLEARL